MDIRLALMTGVDIPVPECQITIHQPTIKEISMISEEAFFSGAQYLCVDKKAAENYVQAINTEEIENFHIFIAIMNSKEASEQKRHVIQVLSLLIPNYKIMFTPRSMLLNNGEENFIIDESNFDSLQYVLKKVFCLQNSQQDNFNPVGDKAKEIAEKLKKGRQKIAEERGRENQNASIFSQYLSILTVGLNSMSLNNLIDLTMYQIYDLIERYGLYINWDLDIRSRLAGGGSDSQPDNWMKNIH